MIMLLSGCHSTPKVTENIPEPGDDYGVVHGILTDSTGAPIEESIFLSQDITFENPELPPTISFSYQSDPRGFINPETGFFYFDQVEPGENYVIAIFTGGMGDLSFVLEKNGNMPLHIKVHAGKVVDLGELVVNISQ